MEWECRYPLKTTNEILSSAAIEFNSRLQQHNALLHSNWLFLIQTIFLQTLAVVRVDPPAPARRHTNVTPKATPKSACPKPGYETHTSKKDNR